MYGKADGNPYSANDGRQQKETRDDRFEYFNEHYDPMMQVNLLRMFFRTLIWMTTFWLLVKIFNNRAYNKR